MTYVYLLRSEAKPDKTYIGQTEDLKTRVREHNAQKSGHGAKHAPWKLELYLAFADHKKALDFERYLKSGSGRAFAKRHLW